MGRFLQRDPIGTKDDVNLYRYVKNSPLNFTDRDGKKAKAFLIKGLNIVADSLILALGIDTTNAPGETNYDEVMARGKVLQDQVDNPSGLALGAAIFLPTPGGKGRLVDGAVMKVDDALTAAEKFLGKGYKELSNGRFVSEDGLKQVRMGMGDILGKHGGGSHINFEQLDVNGKLIPDSKIHIFLND